MMEEGALSRRADAGNVVNGVGADGFLALGAVRADGEPVRFIAQTLDEEQGRIARRQ